MLITKACVRVQEILEQESGRNVLLLYLRKTIKHWFFYEIRYTVRRKTTKIYVQVRF